MTYIRWKNTPAYWRDTVTETTMEEIMLDFFDYGVTAWINDCGYKWNAPHDYIARKFVRFAYMLQQVIKSRGETDLWINYTSHRNLEEDLETFDHFADFPSFHDMIEKWESFYPDLVGTRYDYLIRDFCYIWVNVESGAPGRWTESTLAIDDDIYSDDERAFNGLPDAKWYKSRNDLY